MSLVVTSRMFNSEVTSHALQMSTYTVKKTASSSLIIAVGVFDVCRILQLFFDVFLTVYTVKNADCNYQRTRGSLFNSVGANM